MLTLPKLPYNLGKNRREIVALGGINYSDNTRDGDLADSTNLSARRWPYITTRRARAKQAGYAGCSALCAWEKLVAVHGTDLLYDGEVVGQVSEGEKQFAAVNTKLVIWPDKVYLDLKELELHPLGIEISGSGHFYEREISLLSVDMPSAAEELKPGDCIKIESGQDGNDGREVIVESVAVDSSRVTITISSYGEPLQETGGNVRWDTTIKRIIPDLDYICESENRLWGCSTADQTVYVSALGDPTNFNLFQGLSTDSYAVAVGSPEPFTGCCKLGSSVLFWKENRLHKVLGSYPAEYSLHTYSVDGLRPGCHKSLCIIDEVLYYMGLRGVYAYGGSSPSLISAAFGERSFSDAVGGTDGDSYYLSVKEGGKTHLLVYEVNSGLWLREDDARALDFARIGGSLYMLQDTGEVWLVEGGEDDAGQTWAAQFTPFYETLEGRKLHSKLLLRLELPRGSYMAVHVRFDGGQWRQIAQVIGKADGPVTVRVPTERCDKFELRLSGRGPCTVLGVVREFSVGSEV